MKDIQYFKNKMESGEIYPFYSITLEITVREFEHVERIHAQGYYEDVIKTYPLILSYETKDSIFYRCIIDSIHITGVKKKECDND